MPHEKTNGHRRVTLRDIAQHLDVSHATVSRALNDTSDPFISDATRRRVREAARQMGYRPNQAARNLVTGRTGLLALWLWSMKQPGAYHDAVGRTMHAAALKRRYQLLLDPILPTDDPEGRSRAFDRWNVDGIVAHEAAPALGDALQGGVRPPVPMVATGAFFLVEGVDQVKVDLYYGAVDAVRHLLDGGRRDLVYVTDDLADRHDDARCRAFREVLGEAGIEPRYLDVEGSRKGAREGIKAYVERHGTPDALFCHSDDLALGAYRGLCDLGVRVPHDVALVGFDGIQDCEYLEVPITSVVQPLDRMCDLAFEMLQARMENPAAPLRHERLRAELVVRESSR